MGYLKRINNLPISDEKKASKIAKHEAKASTNRDRQLMYLNVLESQKPNSIMYSNRDANKAARKAEQEAGKKPTCRSCKSRKHRRYDAKHVTV